MTKRLKRIAPLKCGLVTGILYGLFSLIFIPIILLSVGLSLLAPQHTTNGLGQGLGIVFALLLSLFIPVLYAVMGGLMGMLMAWLYNVIASWVGGIEFEVE
jgi:uncharacterized membrane protein YGL010W